MKVSGNPLLAVAVSITMAMLTVVSMPVVVHAQSEMLVAIPFDFYIGTRKFPAGDYSVSVAASGMHLKVSDRDGHSAFVLTSPVSNPESRTLIVGKLLFTRYDNYYFLTEVRRPGYSTAEGIIQSRLETQIAKSSSDKGQVAFAAIP